MVVILAILHHDVSVKLLTEAFQNISHLYLSKVGNLFLGMHFFKLIKRLTLLSLICLPFFTKAQAILSPQAEISVFTIGRGHINDPLFTQFGHSAFRVTDPVRGIDWIYDYGVFDFDAPNFYLKFARGKLNYMLAKRNYDRFAYYYSQRANRDLTEQVLNLDSAQRQEVFNYLEINYLPENRYYLYDFFYDNCATRLPDVLKEVLGERLAFDSTPTEEPLTFRDLIEPRLTDHRWGDLGIDLALGLPTDKIATRYQYMFLPVFVGEEFAKAELKTENGSKLLVKETRNVNKAKPVEASGIYISPGLTFGLVLVLVIGFTFIDYQKKKRNKILDFLLFLSTGLVGLLIVFLWFFTDHTATANNLNIIWALPTNLIIAFYVIKGGTKLWIIRYFGLVAIIIGLLLILWYFLPQPLHYAMLPFVIALGVRSFYFWYFYTKIHTS